MAQEMPYEPCNENHYGGLNLKEQELVTMKRMLCIDPAVAVSGLMGTAESTMVKIEIQLCQQRYLQEDQSCMSEDEQI